MKPERQHQVSQLLDAALAREPNERAAFLAEACAGDAALRREVESFLTQDSRAEGFLAVPALEMLAKAMAPDPGPSLIGRQLGAYQILSLIGVGGMGEVYRARDTRLDREVAVKVLRQEFARDKVRLQRFEREARAAGSLNHPNVLVVYDVGSHEGFPYVVTEFLQGEDLRRRLLGGSLHPSRAVELAIQIASGLAAAHERGIIHRDIKPENLFLMTGGRAKILDFGIAKLVRPENDEGTQTVVSDGTEPGRVLGTAGYMSPEQLRGLSVDRRSDIFSFGAVLYEMLSGRRAFQRDSLIETMGAILREEPGSLLASNPSLSPALERIVKHCLEKKPEDRFQSAHDVALSLDALSLVTVSSHATRTPSASAPNFRKITFRRGNLLHARFTPDGQTVVYSAAWDGEPSELYMTRIDGRESRRLGIAKADLLSVSRSGELAVLLKENFLVSTIGLGTLARVPIGGGSPREVLEDVLHADWGVRDELAVVVFMPTEWNYRIEYPAGQVLHRVRSGHLGSIRVSPNGLRLAFVHEIRANQNSLHTVDKNGLVRTLVQEPGPIRAVCWSPDGEEILFTRKPSSDETAICAVTIDGRMREIYRTDGSVSLCDVSKDGRLLLYRQTNRLEMRCLGAGSDAERDLSWLDGSAVAALSEDGTTLAFREMRSGGGPRGGIYLRKTDGASQPVWLGEGYTCDMSPDGKWMMTLDMGDPPEIILLPTGAGRPKKVPTGGLHPWEGVFLDNERIYFDASGADGKIRPYLAGIDGGQPRLVTEDLITDGAALSPDARFVALVRNNELARLYPLEGGESQPIQGIQPCDVPIQWSPDGDTLYLRRFGHLPLEVYRLNLRTGERELWRTFMPPDGVGVIGIPSLVLTRDERFYAYTCARVVSSELLVADGLL